jgi:adenine-specific DNA methylase
MPKVKNRVYNALPPYLGGKRRLNPWIFGKLAQVIPVEKWQDCIFADAFLGGGAVSVYAKLQGFKTILANDLSQRSQLIIHGLLANQRVKLSKTDTFLFTASLPTEQLPGRIEKTLCPTVFSTRHAQAIDRGLYQAEQTADPAKRALLYLLLWHAVVSFVCFGTSIGSSNRPYAEVLKGDRDWETLNPKRFTDGSLERLLRPTGLILEEKRRVLNTGIVGGSPVKGFQLDASEFVSAIEADILYLDPPYPQTANYERSNQILDLILRGANIEQTISPFSRDTQPLETLLKNAQHIPTWVLSYGSKTLTLEELIGLVSAHAGKRSVQGYAKQYQHMTHVSKTQTNYEYLVIAY